MSLKRLIFRSLTIDPIIAWFAPSLPYSYGPKGYDDLHGLILELQDRKTTYYATNIEISKDKELKIIFQK